MTLKISDYLNHFRTNPNQNEPFKSLLQKFQNEKLRELFLNWGGQTPVPSPAILLYNIINHTDNSFHPDTVLSVCKAFGWETYEDITDWINDCKISDVNTLCSVIWPTFDFGVLQSITWKDVEKTILEQTSTKPHLTDQTYRLVPESKISEIMDKCPSNGFQFIDEQRDCDDYSRIMRGWLSQIGYGNLTIGACEYKCFNDSGKLTFYHAVNLALTDTGKLFILEPQSDVKYFEIDKIADQHVRASRAEIVWVVM